MLNMLVALGCNFLVLSLYPPNNDIKPLFILIGCINITLAQAADILREIVKNGK